MMRSPSEGSEVPAFWRSDVMEFRLADAGDYKQNTHMASR